MDASRAPRVADVMAAMEAWAPAWTAEDWDNVGLIVGHPEASAGRIWVALELDEALLSQAQAAGVDLLLLHHPPLFKPLPNLRLDRPATARLVRAAGAGLALAAAHTNLDAAQGGVNDALAARLGLTDLQPLAPAGGGGQLKLATFVPPDHFDEVARALFAAGAGRIGAYRECAFASQGTGTFLAPQDGNPYLGRAGEREMVSELRLETILPKTALGRVVAALRAAHPYEEPAYDLYPVIQPPAGAGLGRVGRLEPAQDLEAFASAAAILLDSPAPLLAGAPPQSLERVAVVGGSGGEMLAAAAAAGAQLLVTGEARHHAAQEAADLGLGILTLGHFETESVVIEPWARRLATDLATAGFTCEVIPWTGPGPWRPAVTTGRPA
ncbi:MAG: Nif3-like dinuclear metal center hexameric protein [Thermodesulfobacteriota bacterium]